MGTTVLWSISLLLSVSAVNCQSVDNVKALHTYLFTNYNTDVIPNSDQSTPLDIKIKFYLVSLNSFHELEETISILGAFSMSWIDPSLTWDPSSYNNIQNMIIDSKNIWTPSLFLINRVDMMKPVGYDIDFPSHVSPSGEIEYSPGSILEAKCGTTIAKFPFDTQECVLQILPWGVTRTYLTFTSVFDKVQLDWYSENSDWTLKENSTYTGINKGFDMFYIKLRIERQPLYYAVTMIFPTLLFALLNPLVFVMPVQSGERVSFAVTLLLSYAVFLTLVSAAIPASSNPMCVLLICMIVIISISGIITFGCILSTAYYYKDNMDGISECLKRLAAWKLSKRLNIVTPVDEQKEQTVTCIDIASVIDILFFYGSYLGIAIVIITYVVYAII